MKNLKIFTDNIEQEAIDQISTLMEQPAFSLGANIMASP